MEIMLTHLPVSSTGGLNLNLDSVHPAVYELEEVNLSWEEYKEEMCYAQYMYQLPMMNANAVYCNHVLIQFFFNFKRRKF